MFIVLSAPSGAGKTTIARAVMERFPALSFSVSATTRARRPAERDGIDYYFLTLDEFHARTERGEFVEWEEVFGNAYGTLHSELLRATRDGRHLLFDVDVKGALSIKRNFPRETVSIFIDPPGMDVLRERLERRRTDSPEVIATRLARAAWEREQRPLFDHVVVNDDLPRAIDAVSALVATALGATQPDATQSGATQPGDATPTVQSITD